MCVCVYLRAAEPHCGGDVFCGKCDVGAREVFDLLPELGIDALEHQPKVAVLLESLPVGLNHRRQRRVLCFLLKLLGKGKVGLAVPRRRVGDGGGCVLGQRHGLADGDEVEKEVFLVRFDLNSAGNLPKHARG